MRRARWLLLGLSSCLDPTEVRVTLQTDACELGDVEIFLGDSNAPVATQSGSGGASCTPGVRRIGSLVFVPSNSATPRFKVRAEGALGMGTCKGSTPSRCIVAKRSVTYVAHRPIDITIDLTSDCADTICPKDFTCVHGECKSDIVQCDPSQCGVVDAGERLDGPKEAALVCTSPAKFLASATLQESHYWAMSDPLADTHSMVSQSLENGATLDVKVPPAGCSPALNLGTGSQALGVSSTTNGIGAAFYLRIAGPLMADTFVLARTGALNGSVLFGVNALSQVFVKRCGQTLCTIATAVVTLTANKWHPVEVLFSATGQVTAWIDGQPANISGNNTGMGAVAGMLVLSPTGANGIGIDELHIYDVP